MNNDIANEVKELIAKILEVSVNDINEDTAIGDLPQWDSLHHLEIISAVEEKFNFRFTPEVMMDLEDVSDIIHATEERAEK